jgi:hypothetical protein
MPGPAEAGTVTWLVLAYHLPPESSGLKSLVHRKLTAAGAVYLSRACAVSPVGPVERVMRRMRATIADAGGSAVLLGGCALLGGPEMTVAFNAARDREYDDIIARCRDAVASIETKIATGDFRYKQLSDDDAGLKQLDALPRRKRVRRAWRRKGQEAGSALARCRSILDE